MNVLLHPIHIHSKRHENYFYGWRKGWIYIYIKHTQKNEKEEKQNFVGTASVSCEDHSIAFFVLFGKIFMYC